MKRFFAAGWFVRSLTLLALSAVISARADVEGTVFEDRDGDGKLTAGEPGLAKVAVTNGEAVTLTDEQGHYRLAAGDKSNFIFVIKPSGYQTALDADKQPRFYYPIRANDRSSSVHVTQDFALTRTSETPDFKIFAFTDIQPDSAEDLSFFNRTMANALANAQGYAFGVNLGDIANDHPDLYDGVAHALGHIGVPWHEIIGNHDTVVSGGEGGTATLAFEKKFGPSTYAFRYADTLFLALNNIRPIGGPRYIGGLTPEQFTFIANVLKLTSHDNRVVVLTHMPWFNPGVTGTATFRAPDRARLFDLLKDYSRVFFLSGHTHAQRHLFYGAADGWNGAHPIHEYNVAAACGGFWGGPRNEEGIPASTMWDGTPNGYGIVTFSADAEKTQYRPAQYPADHQIALHSPAVAHSGLGYVSYWANVFNGHEGWTVEGRVGSEIFHPLQRVIEWDPSYAAAYLAQDLDLHPAPGKRLPDPTACFHLWRGALPPTLKQGNYDVEIRATSPEGEVFTAKTTVEIVGK